MKLICHEIFPWQVISVDQLISLTPGFVPTHQENPTNDVFLGVLTFVDIFSDFTNVHLMTKMDGSGTTDAKE